MNEHLTETTDWNDLFGKRDFWLSYIETGGESGNYLSIYYGIDDDELDEMDDEETSVGVLIPVVEGYHLLVDIALYGGNESLILFIPPSEGSSPAELELGWDDGNFAYSALRWEEMSAIVKCYEKQISPPFSPVYLPLLLKKFTPTTETDDLPSIVATLEQLWRQTGLFTADECQELAQKMSFIQHDLHWVFDPERGWVARGFDSYSLRYYGPGWPDSSEDDPYVENDFDHNSFAEFMRAVDRLAGTVVAES